MEYFDMSKELEVRYGKVAHGAGTVWLTIIHEKAIARVDWANLYWWF